MKVGYLQYAPVFGEVARNLARMRDLALDGARGVDLLVLPELAATGYLFQSREEARELAEPVEGGRTAEEYGALARELGAAVVGGLAERAGGRVFNASLLVTPDGRRVVYRKTHLFWDEKSWFDRSDEGLHPAEVDGVRLGQMICFDWYFPEVARVLAIRGAQVLCHPSNLVLTHCPAAMRTRCLENRVFAITANRCGSDRRGGQELRFVGRSQIVGPTGEVLISASEEEEEVGVAEIEPRDADDKSITPRNDCLGDRRPELYGDIAKARADHRGRT